MSGEGVITRMNRAATIARICQAFSASGADSARELAQSEYPYEPPQRRTRPSVSKVDSVRVFMRDQFTDRYTGQQLIFPGTLLLLAELVPGSFPYHSNWKRSESHQVYWELWPTIDHIQPWAGGGAHESANWVTTSMLTNMHKGDRRLEQTDLRLIPLETLPRPPWDGLLSWFRENIERCGERSLPKAVKDWDRAQRRAAIP